MEDNQFINLKHKLGFQLAHALSLLIDTKVSLKQRGFNFGEEGCADILDYD